MNTTSLMTTDLAKAPIATFVFAHGAGADKDSDFMRDVAQMLADNQVNVVRFNFPYMVKAAETGKKRPPDRGPVLQQTYLEVLHGVDDELPVFIGGKSMGGRISTLILEQSKAKGAICFGYPFHPPAKPEKLRTEHLEDISKPVLILQGERDTFGNQQEVREYSLSPVIEMFFLADGDHSLKPRKASGLTQQQHLETAVAQCLAFITNNLNKN